MEENSVVPGIDVKEYLSDIDDLPEELKEKIENFILKLSERKRSLAR